MEIIINKLRLALVQGDITRQDTDAIVNAANSGLLGGGGVDGAIHRAGGPPILDECRRIRAKQGMLPAGQAVITTGGNLKARYVIHAVGPVWHGGRSKEAEVLASAYHESLKLAVSTGLRSISFPSISTGAYAYPVEEAAGVALRTAIDFLRREGKPDEVIFVLYSDPVYRAYEHTLKKLSEES